MHTEESRNVNRSYELDEAMKRFLAQNERPVSYAALARHDPIPEGRRVLSTTGFPYVWCAPFVAAKVLGVSYREALSLLAQGMGCKPEDIRGVMIPDLCHVLETHGIGGRARSWKGKRTVGQHVKAMARIASRDTLHIVVTRDHVMLAYRGMVCDNHSHHWTTPSKAVSYRQRVTMFLEVTTA